MSAHDYILRVMSGDARGPVAGALRGGLRLVEVPYTAAMRRRNARYDRTGGVPLGRPTVSVGNLTAGGTGKTPVVRWLATRLAAAGVTPAVLLRGYKGDATGGDEARMLAAYLAAYLPWGPVIRANPDRVAAARVVLRDRPDVGAFVLDDAFQHRRATRDADLVLINAADPFGFGHVHPRGLLREPVDGVRRASAVLLTHADRATPAQLADIDRVVRQHNPSAPIFRCRHAWVGFRTAKCDAANPPDQSVEALATKKYFAIAGVGHPAAIEARLAGPNFVGRRWFADHHRYTLRDWQGVVNEADRAGAEVVVTTEKDWVKWTPGVVMGADMDVWRIDVAVEFEADHEARLFELIAERLRVGGERAALHASGVRPSSSAPT